MAIILLFTSAIAFAQAKIDTLVHSEKPALDNGTIRICVPSRGSQIHKQPLYVIKYGKKEYRNNKLNSVLSKMINPNDIESINIFKDSVSLAKYGDDGKYGVVVITLKKDKISDFRKNLREFKAKGK